MVWPLVFIFWALTMKISCYFIAFLVISGGFRLVLAAILADLTTEIHENTNEINQNNMISSSLVAENQFQRPDHSGCLRDLSANVLSENYGPGTWHQLVPSS